MERVLIIGANGQIGSELVIALRARRGDNAVIASDISPAGSLLDGNGPFLHLDVLDEDALRRFIREERITIVYHMAALLSATAERHPMKAWRLNMDGLLHVLNACVEMGVKQLFWPSSIAAFGPDAPKENTPQVVPMNPDTVYGITKVAGEQLCAWYHRKHGLDVRSLRYPGLISHRTLPGGGTTDYAIDIFHAALSDGTYTCFLKPDASLPFMYMDDAIAGTLQLMDTPADRITVRTSYNITAFSLSPHELATEIRKHIPEFRISYEPDYRQQFAESWPRSIDDSQARTDWNWKPRFELSELVEDMLKHVRVLTEQAD